MIEVEMFDEKIVLDKTIYVTLDNSWELFEIHPEALQEFCYAGDWSKVCEAIKQGRTNIITPITKCVSSHFMEKGYEIIVQSKNKSIRFSELLMGNCEKSFGREIRCAQNWEKMLFSNCFDIDIPDIIGQ